MSSSPLSGIVDRLRSKVGAKTAHEAAEEPPDDWRGWLRALFPDYVGPFAGRHERFWEWAWSIGPQDNPRPYVGIWPRGGGKSTSAELATCALGLREACEYAVYVRATQDLADTSVDNIRKMIESSAVERYYPAHGEPEFGKFGNRRGWRRQRLRTAGGLTVDALGLDAAARGAKVDEARPDLIILDDIDDKHDTARATRKKLTTLKDTVLGMLSDDGSAVIAIQNLVLPNGVFARLADGRADFLQTRIVDGPYPAIEDLETTRQQDPETGEWRDVIVSGTPTWEGQDLEDCQARIDRSGLSSFRRECQNNVSEREGALWSRACLNAVRSEPMNPRDLRRIVVGVDPSGGTDEIGIVVAGVGHDGTGYTGYVVDDRSVPGSVGPNRWGKAVRDAYDDWSADCICVEANYGGDLVTSNVRGVSGRHLPIKKVNATRGKEVRAEPVAGLYGDPDVDWEDAQLLHAGTFADLEEQMTSWVPGDADSPDRLDALVWAMHELMLNGAGGASWESFPSVQANVN